MSNLTQRAGFGICVNGERIRVTDRRHCDRRISRENSLYRTVTHTLSPLNGKLLFLVSCDVSILLFKLMGHKDLQMFPFIL